MWTLEPHDMYWNSVGSLKIVLKIQLSQFTFHPIISQISSHLASWASQPVWMTKIQPAATFKIPVGIFFLIYFFSHWGSGSANKANISIYRRKIHNCILKQNKAMQLLLHLYFFSSCSTLDLRIIHIKGTKNHIFHEATNKYNLHRI